MKKIFIAIIAIVTSTISTYSIDKISKQQYEAPDFAQIKELTTLPSSNSYFPKLVKRYTSNDTTMTLDDYRNLYYGFIFQEDYDPYRRSQFSKKVEHLYYKSTHTLEECDTIMKYAELSLADNPFELRQMMFLIIALKEKQKHARASIWQFRLNHIIGAILSSGNGTQEAPWYVISPAHEYNLLNFMNYVVTSHKDIDDGVMDYLTITPPEGSQAGKAPEGFYFNVAEIARVFDDRFSEKK